MARPRKQTVDYFPHNCTHGKTLFILEKNYGNNGYSFWFKLLEMLGSTEGHSIDLNDIAVWEFLKAKTFMTDESCTEILNLLAKLNAIDSELWSEKIVWCQNFVDGIEEVYKNRRVDIPLRPSFYRDKPQQDVVSTDEKPQSKVKETKVNKSKVNKESIASILLSIDNPKLQNALDEFVDMRKTIKAKLTPHALKLIINKLDKLAKDDDTKIKILERSIESSWKGVFPLGDNFKNDRNIKREVPNPSWMDKEVKDKEVKNEELKKMLKELS